MVVLVLVGAVMAVYLLRRWVGAPRTSVTVSTPRPYNPDRAHFQRLPGGRGRRRL